MNDIKEKVKAATELCLIFAEVIRELGSVPSGRLYAHFMHKMDLDTFNRFISTLKDAGLVREQNFMLSWVKTDSKSTV